VKLLIYVQHVHFLSCIQFYILPINMLSGEGGKGIERPKKKKKAILDDSFPTHPEELQELSGPESASQLSSPSM
jgi:hypothetical protein